LKQDTFTIPVLGTRAPINNLKPGTEYNVTVQTAFERLRSEDSDPVIFTTGKKLWVIFPSGWLVLPAGWLVLPSGWLVLPGGC